MFKALFVVVVGLAGLQLNVDATPMGDDCATSGAKVDWTYSGRPDVSYEKLPEEVAGGMEEHKRRLGVVERTEEWPDCWSGPGSFGCQGEGYFCQCIRPYGGGDWHCGCETGEC